MNEKDIVYEYIINSKSINSIAKQYKCSWGKVKKILINNNVKIISKRNQYGAGANISDDLFKNIDADSAYWLGLLYADGSIRKDRNEVTLELQEKDFKTICDYHKFCNNNNSINKHIIIRDGKKYVSYSSSFSNKAVKKNLEKLGCTPKKSFTLTFPTSELIPEDYLYDFVRGYIDGDGYVQYDYNKSRYRICILGTYRFLSGLVKRTGWTEKSKIYKDGNIYKLELSGKELVLKKLIRLYENSKYHLDRKYKVYEQALLGK